MQFILLARLHSELPQKEECRQSDILLSLPKDLQDKVRSYISIGNSFAAAQSDGGKFRTFSR